MVLALGDIGLHNFLFLRHLADNIFDNIVQRDDTGQVAELIDHNTKVVLFLAEGVEDVLRIGVLREDQRLIQHGADVSLAVLLQFHEEILDIQHTEVVFHMFVTHKHTTNGEVVQLLDKLLLRLVDVNPLDFRTVDHDMHGAFVGEGEDILVHLALFLLNDIGFASLLDNIQQFILSQMVFVCLNTENLVNQHRSTGKGFHSGLENHANEVHDGSHRHRDTLGFGKADGFGH